MSASRREIRRKLKEEIKKRIYRRDSEGRMLRMDTRTDRTISMVLTSLRYTG